MRTELLTTATGTFQVSVPNETMDGDGFYISYNDTDVDIYGSDTTAIVVGQMQRFFILKGDHRAHYAGLVSEGLDACLAYYEAHLDAAHSHSDKLPLDLDVAPSVPKI